LFHTFETIFWAHVLYCAHRDTATAAKLSKGHVPFVIIRKSLDWFQHVWGADWATLVQSVKTRVAEAGLQDIDFNERDKILQVIPQSIRVGQRTSLKRAFRWSVLENQESVRHPALIEEMSSRAKKVLSARPDIFFWFNRVDKHDQYFDVHAVRGQSPRFAGFYDYPRVYARVVNIDAAARTIRVDWGPYRGALYKDAGARLETFNAGQFFDAVGHVMTLADVQGTEYGWVSDDKQRWLHLQFMYWNHSDEGNRIISRALSRRFNPAATDPARGAHDWTSAGMDSVTCMLHLNHAVLIAFHQALKEKLDQTSARRLVLGSRAHAEARLRDARDAMSSFIPQAVHDSMEYNREQKRMSIAGGNITDQLLYQLVRDRYVLDNDDGEVEPVVDVADDDDGGNQFADESLASPYGIPSGFYYSQSSVGSNTNIQLLHLKKHLQLTVFKDGADCSVIKEFDDTDDSVPRVLEKLNAQITGPSPVDIVSYIRSVGLFNAAQRASIASNVGMRNHLRIHAMSIFQTAAAPPGSQVDGFNVVGAGREFVKNQAGDYAVKPNEVKEGGPYTLEAGVMRCKKAWAEFMLGGVNVNNQLHSETFPYDKFTTVADKHVVFDSTLIAQACGEDDQPARLVSSEYPVCNPYAVHQVHKNKKCMFFQTVADFIGWVGPDNGGGLVVGEYKTVMEWNDSPASAVMQTDYLRQVYTNARLVEMQTGLQVKYALLIILLRRATGQAATAVIRMHPVAPSRQLAFELEALDIRARLECAPSKATGGFIMFDGRLMLACTRKPREFVATCLPTPKAPACSGLHLTATCLKTMMPAFEAWREGAARDLAPLPVAPQNATTRVQPDGSVHALHGVAYDDTATREELIQAAQARARAGEEPWYAVTAAGQPKQLQPRLEKRREGWDFLAERSLHHRQGRWVEVPLIQPGLVPYDPLQPLATTTRCDRQARLLIFVATGGGNAVQAAPWGGGARHSLDPYLVADVVFEVMPPRLVQAYDARPGEPQPHTDARNGLNNLITANATAMRHRPNSAPITVFNRICQLQLNPLPRHWDEHIENNLRFGPILMANGAVPRMENMRPLVGGAGNRRGGGGAQPSPQEVMAQAKIRSLQRLVDEEVMRAFAIRDASLNRGDGMSPAITWENFARIFLHNSERPFWSQEVLEWAAQHLVQPLTDYMQAALL
jgi:hypothetical protein